MPTPKDEPRTERDPQSTRPENWPGIPGRSEEHEAPEREGSEVTEAQRRLEREMREAEREADERKEPEPD